MLRKTYLKEHRKGLYLELVLDGKLKDVYKRQKRIRVHDLRHSHVSLLINMGFTVLAIADRMGPVSYTHLDVYKRQGEEET